MKKVLTIAGSDCSGGAGVQADLKTMMAHGCYGMSVITSLTAQNTTGVYAIEDCSVDFIKKQLDCVFTDIYPDAIKIGMVASSEIMHAIAEKLVEHKATNIVLDPVMVSTSGSPLIKEDSIQTLKEVLMPLATLITPNLHEAEILCGKKMHTADEMIEGAKSIAEFYKGAILIKGGHLEGNANDLLYKDGEAVWFKGEKIDNDNTHGTGCTLSSAIASHLALGHDEKDSVKGSKAYITKALKAMLDLGKGDGPLNHYAPIV